MQNSVWVSGSIDDRDLNYDPSSGWFAKQQLSWTGLIPSLETEFFLRTDTKAEVYFTLLDLPGINLSVNMSILSLCIYIISMFTSGIYIGRLPIYFSLHNYLLLPWIIERFFEKNTAKVIYVLLIACYMIFYYYQMHIVWGDVISQ